MAMELNVQVISNNLANMTTTGYKRQRAEFQDLLYDHVSRVGTQTSSQGNILPVGIDLGSGVKTVGTGRLMSQGSLTQTGNPFDVAIRGDGFFKIQLPDGTYAYSRDGSFKTDAQGRIVTAQTLGGTGALKVGADFLRRIAPNAEIWISDPSWENHRAIFTQAGFTVETYPYYNAARRGIDFDSMLTALNAAPEGTIVVLHACCHNPTGYDLTPAQWDQVIPVLKARKLVPFIDMAYQGFGQGIAEDGAVIGKFVASGLDCFVATSFSKSFSLYGERVGALSVLCANKEEAARVLSQLKIVIRANYSNPPTHGGQVVATVLNTPQLRALWEQELAAMRVRIKEMRKAMVQKLKAAGVKQDVSYIQDQVGMFSYSGLSKEQMVRLRNEFAVYGTDSGRICVAAVNSKNIEHVCQSIAKVI